MSHTAGRRLDTGAHVQFGCIFPNLCGAAVLSSSSPRSEAAPRQPAPLPVARPSHLLDVCPLPRATSVSVARHLVVCDDVGSVHVPLE